MKKFIIPLVIFIILIVSISVFFYFISFKDISFSVKQSDLSFDIYNSKNQKLATLTGSSSTRLQDGEYYYVPKGEAFDLSRHSFTVNKSTKTIDVDPDYSGIHLATLLSTENNAIQSVINVKYLDLMKNYTINDQKLFNKGEWYGAVLKYKTSDPNDLKDPYRIILHKVNNGWEIIHFPEIVVTKTDFPTVPIDVLNSVNNLLDS